MRRADLNGYAIEFVECFRAIQHMKEKGIEIEILSKNDPAIYVYGPDVLFGMAFTYKEDRYRRRHLIVFHEEDEKTLMDVGYWYFILNLGLDRIGYNDDLESFSSKEEL